MYEQFDAIIIGSGQGGTPLAQAAAQHGWKTALVERRFLGGICTNDGCTPTKTLVASARVAELTRRGAEYGVRCDGFSIDFARVMERQRDLGLSGREEIEKRLSQQEGLEVIYGEASFADQQPSDGRHAVLIRPEQGRSRELVAERVFLDVGQRPSIPEIDGLQSVPYLDSTSILNLETVPRHLLILGGGYIAVEFAQLFRRFGSLVTIIERGSRFLEREDNDIAACLASILEEDGVDIRLQTRVTGAHAQGGAVSLDLESGDGKAQLEGSHLLVATGRVPCVESLHLDRVGVTLTEKNYIRVNERLETSQRGIWALGDVTGGPPYTHASYDDFRVLRNNLFEEGKRTTSERLVPYCIFTDP